MFLDCSNGGTSKFGRTYISAKALSWTYGHQRWMQLWKMVVILSLAIFLVNFLMIRSWCRLAEARLKNMATNVYQLFYWTMLTRRQKSDQFNSWQPVTCWNFEKQRANHELDTRIYPWVAIRVWWYTNWNFYFSCVVRSHMLLGLTNTQESQQHCERMIYCWKHGINPDFDWLSSFQRPI